MTVNDKGALASRVRVELFTPRICTKALLNNTRAVRYAAATLRGGACSEHLLIGDLSLLSMGPDRAIVQRLGHP